MSDALSDFGPASTTIDKPIGPSIMGITQQDRVLNDSFGVISWVEAFVPHILADFKNPEEIKIAVVVAVLWAMIWGMIFFYVVINKSGSATEFIWITALMFSIISLLFPVFKYVRKRLSH